tara:strand:- start:30 stop:353 length:324 start_codon:yes stop_codon:yes gene_type:complete
MKKSDDKNNMFDINTLISEYYSLNPEKRIKEKKMNPIKIKKEPVTIDLTRDYMSEIDKKIDETTKFINEMQSNSNKQKHEDTTYWGLIVILISWLGASTLIMVSYFS